MNRINSVVSDFGRVYGADSSTSGKFSAAVDAIGAVLAIKTIEVGKIAMQAQYQDYQRIFDVKA